MVIMYFRVVMEKLIDKSSKIEWDGLGRQYFRIKENSKAEQSI